MGLAARPVSAQVPWLGPTLGISSSSYSGEFSGFGGSPFSSRTGIAAGLDAEVRFSPTFALGTGAFYVQKGAVGSQPNYPSLRAGYLEVPLGIRVKLPLGPFRAFADGGTTVAVETNCTMRLEFNQKLGCGFEGLDFGATLGAGLQLVTNGITMMVLARRNWGLRNLTPDVTGYPIYNRTSTISASILRRLR